MILFWVAILALSILLYVLLDGFDLGVGILFGFTRDEARRNRMLSAISPVWDGNETWLVIAGTVLFGAFSKVYALLLSAFYLPVIIMLAALILRGVAFEFRHQASRSRPLWSFGFSAGSLVATFVQGTMVGALARGLPIADGVYVGGPFAWCSAFALLCGVGLCLGYALLGACWLVAKTDGDVQQQAWRVIPPLTVGVLAFLAIAFVQALAESLAIMHRWVERPYLLAFPAIGLLATAGLLRGVTRRSDGTPLPMTMLVFAMAFATMAAAFWPYMVPFGIRIEAAASPNESLSFMFWGAGLFVVPLVLLYNVIAYRVFSGKTTQSMHYH